MEIVAALITGIFGLLTGLIIGFKDEIILFFSSSKRSLSGTWVGTAYDIEVPEHLKYKYPLEYEFTIELEQSGTKVKGKVLSKSDVLSVQIANSILYQDTFLIGEYYDTDKNTFDRGVVVLQYYGSGKKLKGYFLGNRSRENGIAFGHMELTKKI